MLSSFSNSVRFAMPSLAMNRIVVCGVNSGKRRERFQPAVSGRRRKALIEESQHGVHSDVKNSPDSSVSQTECNATVAIGGREASLQTHSAQCKIGCARSWRTRCYCIVARQDAGCERS